MVHAVGSRTVSSSPQMPRDWDDRYAATTTTIIIIIVALRHASFDRLDTRTDAPLHVLVVGKGGVGEVYSAASPGCVACFCSVSTRRN